MHAVVSSLLAASLLLHAVLGCCRHHAHDPAVSTVGAAADRNCCHDHQGCGDHHAPANRCPGKSDCQGVCTYLPTQKTQVELPLLAAPWSAVSLPGALTDGLLRVSPAWLDALVCTVAPPHVRLHLAQLVLVI